MATVFNNPMLLEKNSTAISFEKFIQNLSNLKFNKEPHTFGIKDDNILNDFANYLITYLFIIIAIINDDNNLLIAACLITPFPNDLKTAFYNISSNPWYISYIFLIIVLYFLTVTGPVFSPKYIHPTIPFLIILEVLALKRFFELIIKPIVYTKRD